MSTHWYLCEALIAQAKTAIEGERKVGEQEIMKCEAMLETNKMAESLIHTANSRRLGSERSLIASNPPTLEQLLKLKAKNLVPFVQARSLYQGCENSSKSWNCERRQRNS